MAEVTVGYRWAPGQCFGCGDCKATSKVLDLGKDDPSKVQLHRVYLCETCILSAAQQMLKGTGRSIAKDALVAGLKADLRAAQARIAAGDEALRLLRELRELVPDEVTS